MPQINRITYSEIGRRMREIPVETHVSSYEWEELVQKLCDSDDARLHDIGIRERGNILSMPLESGKK
jgi:hypothetical protein